MTISNSNQTSILTPRKFRYFIIFQQTNELKNETIIFLSKETIRDYSNQHHILDQDLLPVLDIVKYCLHLPRNEFDTCDISFKLLDAFYDEPQDICLCPLSYFETMLHSIKPDFVFSDDSCFEEVTRILEKNKTEAQCFSKNMLSNNLLVDNWKYLFEQRNFKELRPIQNIDTQYILDYERIIFLPYIFLSRHLGNVMAAYNKSFNSFNLLEDSPKYTYNALIHFKTLVLYEKDFKNNFDEKIFYEHFNKTKEEFKPNIVIECSGVSFVQINKGNMLSTPPDFDRKTIRLITVHRSLAKNAPLLVLENVCRNEFEMLNNFEIAANNNAESGIQTSNKFTHRSLNSISKLFNNKLQQWQKYLLAKSSKITLFSNFPYGLCTLDNNDTPLLAQKEFSNHILSPLTRSLQFELFRHPVRYFGDECKVLLIECVENSIGNSFVRACTNNLAQNLKHEQEKHKKFIFCYKEAYSISDLLKIVNENEADILILSAHGFYDYKSNISGLIIGKERFFGDADFSRMPPVVILCACSVSPRGSGCVNAADLFLRMGAETVISTLIPISAKRNMYLINRVMAYLIDALDGQKIYKTFSDMWSGVVATNAIFEIAFENENFEKWLLEKNNGTNNFEEFALKRSKGRLRKQTIYADTIMIVKEMLTEQGLEGRFKDVLDNKNYFPESFFYQIIGYPENIIIYDDKKYTKTK